MPFSQLVRNKKAIIDALYVDNTNAMLVKQDLKVIIPVRYEETKLATIESTVYTLAIFAIQVGNEYAVNNVPARIKLFPSDISKVKYEHHEYYILRFDKGSIFTDNINLIKTNTLGYNVYNYFINLGKIPWFMSAVDALSLFDNMLEYTGVNYGASASVQEMLCSMIMRSKDNLQDYWRQSIQTVDDVFNNRPDYVELRNVAYGARSTTAKLMGSYFDEGLNSAFINPSETTERVEELLRQ